MLYCTILYYTVLYYAEKLNINQRLVRILLIMYYTVHVHSATVALASAGRGAAGRKSGIVWSPSVFSRRFRGSCRNPDEVHGTLTARRQFPIRFSVGTDPDKKNP